MSLIIFFFEIFGGYFFGVVLPLRKKLKSLEDKKEVANRKNSKKKSEVGDISQLSDEKNDLKKNGRKWGEGTSH